MKPDRRLSKLKASAVEAALASGALLKKHYRKRLDIREKQDAGLVTQVDLAAERAAIRILKRAFPEFSFLAEESGATASRASLRQAVGRWIIDPLDGTTNYVHGFPMFCVSIGAELEGELAVGVIYHPLLNDLYIAVRGQGATLNGKRISVSKSDTIRDTLLTTGFTYQKAQILHAEIEVFERFSAVARAVRRPGSAALDLAYTASGVFDGFWERNLSPWDVAAGVLLVREAGGCVTDFNGDPFQIHHSEILATNCDLHPQLFKIIKRNAK